MATILDRVARKVQKQHRRAQRPPSRHAVRDPLAVESTAAPPTGLTVLGPYPNRAGYRLVIKENSAREARCFPTLEEAQRVREELLREATRRSGLAVGELLERYRCYLIEERGVKPDTAAHVLCGLRALLPVELRIAALTTEKIRDSYRDLTQRISEKTGKPRSVTTHQVWLIYGKSFGKWAVENKHLSTNPFTGVRPIGKRSAGKLQHTVAEANKLDALALARAQSGDTRALGVLLMIHLGLRRGEVNARKVRDVDQSGTVLWIPSGKTHNARRRLKVPEFLQPLLRAQTEGRSPDDALFTTNAGNPVFRNYFWVHLRSLCVDAGVPVVCPHSLRGLHASLALEAGATSESVARALGHGSFSVTKKHYATADSVTANRQQQVSRALGTDTRERIASFLSTLSPTETAELKRQLLSHAPSSP